MNERRRARVFGSVQGVGFRPFVLRIAKATGLGGFVRNHTSHVTIEVEGSSDALDRFAAQLADEVPGAADIRRIDWQLLSGAEGEGEFRILGSAADEDASLVLPPDLSVCRECLDEATTPGNRRFGYGFGSCTQCGPRFTIARSTPWDRDRTSMNAFSICATCSEEYRDSGDRRHHAQTIACPACGPQLTLLSLPDGKRVAAGHDAMDRAIQVLERGGIVGFKGIGGFVLLTCADDEHAVSKLRVRKRRPQKPMAVMVANLERALELARLDHAECEALVCSSSPIVLCDLRPGTPIAPSVLQGISRIGLMLPSTPLHGLLSNSVGRPLVATSANLHDEPLCIERDEAIATLGDIADVLLDHDRDILRPCDDSVVDVVGGATRILRRARGFAPERFDLGCGSTRPVLAVGGHLKVAPALVVDGEAVLWPHIGNLDRSKARTRFEDAVVDIESFFDTRATHIARDAHPDYATTLWAERDGRPTLAIQHHHAHVAACLAEWGLRECLGVAWDGVGYGEEPDHAARLWGGEFLRVGESGFERMHHWLPFPLVGGDVAARDGRRALAGMAAEAGLAIPALERLQRVAHLAPRTTSVGRMFDAVAALLGVCEQSSFEGEAAMRLENIASPGGEPYPFELPGRELDWRPMLFAMMNERAHPERVASRFHATLAKAIVEVAKLHEANVVALTGGCFQNRLLLELARRRLEEHGIRAITPMRVPPGDGGLALGQAWVALRRLRDGK